MSHQDTATVVEEQPFVFGTPSVRASHDGVAERLGRLIPVGVDVVEDQLRADEQYAIPRHKEIGPPRHLTFELAQFTLVKPGSHERLKRIF